MAASIEIKTDESLATLVTLVRVGHLTGDTALEQVARGRLLKQYGIRVTFSDRATRNREGHANG